MLYPLARKKPNARYIGEIYKAESTKAVREALEPQNIRFVYPGDTVNAFYALRAPDVHVRCRTSPTTGSATSTSTSTTSTPSGSASAISLTADEQGKLDRADALQAGARHQRTWCSGVDHMATRILAGEREDAMLEYLTMVPYYFWGAYNIHEMNSSTNVTQAPRHRRRQEVAGARVHGQQHAVVRELVRQPADADRGLRPQLRPPDAPHGDGRHRRPRRRREERRLRGPPARRHGHAVPGARRRRVQGRPEPEADLLEELAATRC